MKTKHNVNIRIDCKLGGPFCKWKCSVNFDCFLEHAKHVHGVKYEVGASTVFNPERDFFLTQFTNDYPPK